MIALGVAVLNHPSMARKLTDEEFGDPEFQALFVALEKASKPVVQTITERTRATFAALKPLQPERLAQSTQREAVATPSPVHGTYRPRPR
jgi:hypothetical protein